MAAFVIRPPRPTELDALSALQMRSKAHWGYDAAFMAACEHELTLTSEKLAGTAVAVGEPDGQVAGIAQVGPRAEDADLMALFIDPPFMGAGLGRELFHWCVSTAQRMSRTRLLIDSDPGAEAFYLHMGAQRIGRAPSGSIPGRMLPLLAYDLR